MVRYLFGIIFMAVCLQLTAQNYTISGFIKDKTTGEALIGTNIYDPITLKGTTSNTFGYYSLTLPSDSITLLVSYVGYQKSIIKLFLDENKELNIDMASFELDEVVIYAEETVEQKTTMSTINIPIEQIKSLPTHTWWG